MSFLGRIYASTHPLPLLSRNELPVPGELPRLVQIREATCLKGTTVLNYRGVQKITVKTGPWGNLLRHLGPGYLPVGQGGAQGHFFATPSPLSQPGSSQSKGFKPPRRGVLPKPPSAACPAFFSYLVPREGAPHSFPDRES